MSSPFAIGPLVVQIFYWGLVVLVLCGVAYGAWQVSAFVFGKKRGDTTEPEQDEAPTIIKLDNTPRIDIIEDGLYRVYIDRIPTDLLIRLRSGNMITIALTEKA